MSHDAAKLIRAFGHESGFEVRPLLMDEPFNFSFEFIHLACCQSHATRPVGSPAIRPVESMGGQIRSEKRDGPQADLLGAGCDLAQGAVVCFLNSATGA